MLVVREGRNVVCIIYSPTVYINIYMYVCMYVWMDGRKDLLDEQSRRMARPVITISLPDPNPSRQWHFSKQ